MKARLPQEYRQKGGGMNMMLQKAQKAQEEMETLRAELDEREYTAQSGGGMVTATVTGKHQLVRLEIKPEIVDPEDIEMLEDLVSAAVNEAMRTADATAEEEMAKITADLQIPGMDGLF